MTSNEIPREIEVPKLSPGEIKKITRVVFAKSNPQKADIIFILGSTGGDWETIANLYHAGQAPKLIVNGLTGKKYDETGQPLAQYIRDELIKNSVPRTDIIVQDRSTNTLEDVKFGKEELNKHGIKPKTILFASKSHHSGRVFLTLKKYFPDVMLYPFTYNATYESVEVKSSDWWKHPSATKRVYGEFVRINTYSARGDIALPSKKSGADI